MKFILHICQSGTGKCIEKISGFKRLADVCSCAIAIARNRTEEEFVAIWIGKEACIGSARGDFEYSHVFNSAALDLAKHKKARNESRARLNWLRSNDGLNGPIHSLIFTQPDEILKAAYRKNDFIGCARRLTELGIFKSAAA